MAVKFQNHLKARILSKRADFLRAKASGLKVAMPGFSLQVCPLPAEPGIALGFTCAKRSFGTGVAVNRAKRRLKEAWRLVADKAPNGCILVVVGRVAVLELPFTQLVNDIETALAKAGVLLTESRKTATNAPEIEEI